MNILKQQNHIDHHRFSIAPMLNYTDKDCRYFYRQMTKKALLYTEMICTDTIINKNTKKIIYNFSIENPIAIQLAGKIPIDFAKCAKLAKKMGYNEINLNIGCPSKNMQNSGYGVCLMNQPMIVIKCINAISKVVSLPVSIKTRIGFDNNSHYSFLKNFIKKISNNTNCKIFIIHARIAYLSGINPYQNRNIPKLKYHFIYQIKNDFPHLKIIINGGIKSIKEAKQHLSYVDGVMLGRSVYKNPSLLSQVDKEIFNHIDNNFNIIESIQNMIPYIEKEILQNRFNKKIFRHLLGSFYKLPGSQIWKRKIHELKKDNFTEEINKTLKLISLLYY